MDWKKYRHEKFLLPVTLDCFSDELLKDAGITIPHLYKEKAMPKKGQKFDKKLKKFVWPTKVETAAVEDGLVTKAHTDTTQAPRVESAPEFVVYEECKQVFSNGRVVETKTVHPTPAWAHRIRV